jgi:hypothetical protein
MTVCIYVDTRKQVGDKDHLKVFANQDAARKWFWSLKGFLFRCASSDLWDVAIVPRRVSGNR